MGFGSRPTGVTILAVLSGLMALLFLLAFLGSILVFVLSNNASFIQSLRDSNAPQWIIDNFRAVFAAIAVISLVFLIIYSLLTYGFLKGSRWAWGLGIGFAIIDIVWTFARFVVLPGTSGIVDTAISIVIPLIILVYLMQRNVKTFFFGPGPAIPTTTPMPPPVPPGGQV